MAKDNIWDLAILELKNKESEDREANESSVLFVGNKQAGKSSLIFRFVERPDNPKPALALEYFFGRRSKGLENTKDVCHIWELGGGTLFTHLLEIPITAASLPTLSVVIVLDLSVPEELWFTAETLLNSLRAQVTMSLNELKNSRPNLADHLMEEAWKRVGETHPDKDLIQPFPVPLLFLGSKYDIFQNFDPEKKKIICRCLRYFAHSNGAALQFVSTKSESLMNKGKSTISSLVFHTPRSPASSLDYNKPIIIPFGGDTFQLIGDFAASSEDLSPTHRSFSTRSIDKWKHAFMSYFPQVVTKTVIPDDPGKDPNFRERDIDILRAQKDRELEEWRRRNRSNLNAENWNGIEF